MSLLANSNAIETGGYQISRSVRLRSSASAYLNRTLTTPTNNKIFTYSLWAKRGTLGSAQMLLSGGDGSSNNDAWFGFNSSDQIVFASLTGGAYKIQVNTSAVFRDPSAFYSIVLFVDNTQATNSNGIKIYVNGVNQTLTYTTWVQNGGSSINTANSHYIGRLNYSAIQYLDGYLTEINFIDGQALTPSSFGETDPITGSWVAKKYTGTYGTNGFYLNFSDNSAATSTTIGKDYSGNGNNFTPVNISVTAGVTFDSMLDVPSGSGYADGGNGRGNYCTLNPLDKNSGITLSNGNLDASMPTQLQNVYGTMSVTSGKWYWETTINSLSGRVIIGVGNTVDQSWNLDPSSSSALWGYYSVNGNKLNGSNTAYGNSFTTNDVIGVAVDMDSGKIWFSKNNTWQASGDPAAGTNAAFTNLSGSVRPMYNQQLTNAVTLSCNFGQRPFSYTPPTGFKALNTTNLSDPTIKKGSSYFDVVTRAGTAATANITSLSFQPDFVWFKSRGRAVDHALYDSVRGVEKRLETNNTDAEVTGDTTGLTAFNSNGYTIGALDQINGTTATNSFVDWAWKANGTGVTNTAGTITSTVSANTTSGFAIATTTGAGGTGTIGHGLGAVPQFIMCFRRNTAADHYCYHQAIGNTNFLVLNTTAASAASANLWNNTTPTSTVFSVGNTNNNSGDTYVHYIFAPVPGYSAFGSYTGNGSTDGPFVFCGFRPRYVFQKRTDTTGSWRVWDTSRSTYNVAAATLLTNSSGAELTTSNENFDILSNGFKLRNADSEQNASGGTYIFAAFAENPFKYSNAR